MKGLLKITDYKVLAPYQIWLRYEDGVSGAVDLAYLTKNQVFEPWSNPVFFNQMKVVRGRRVYWSEEIDLCPDALYMKITGKNPYR